jgi:hypothetical protein
MLNPRLFKRRHSLVLFKTLSYTQDMISSRLPSLKTCITLLPMLTNAANAHMEMSWPYPLKSKFVPGRAANDIDYNNMAPLDASGSQFPCKGYIPGSDDTSNDDYPIAADGSQRNVTLAGTAYHNGGSCQLSLSYDNGATFRVIKSFIGGCPSGPNAILYYEMPTFAPPGKAYLAWTWLNHEGNREFYMNCAYITITNPSGGDESKLNSQPGIWVANQAKENNCTTTEGVDPVFPDPGFEVQYGGGLSSSSPRSSDLCEIPLPDQANESQNTTAQDNGSQDSEVP